MRTSLLNPGTDPEAPAHSGSPSRLQLESLGWMWAVVSQVPSPLPEAHGLSPGSGRRMLLKKCLLTGCNTGAAKGRQGSLARRWWGNGAFSPDHVTGGSQRGPPSPWWHILDGTSKQIYPKDAARVKHPSYGT